jgi:hypothetical protein
LAIQSMTVQSTTDVPGAVPRTGNPLGRCTGDE